VPEYPLSELTGEIIGAAFEVYNVLGPGFLESVYENALVRELQMRHLAVQQQVRIPIQYKGVEVGTHVLDLIIEDKVIIELKVATELAEVHQAIVLSYLAASKLPVALLLNFSGQRVECKRIVR
jgi:GxxExxY protein